MRTLHVLFLFLLLGVVCCHAAVTVRVHSQDTKYTAYRRSVIVQDGDKSVIYGPGVCGITLQCAPAAAGTTPTQIVLASVGREGCRQVGSVLSSVCTTTTVNGITTTGICTNKLVEHNMCDISDPGARCTTTSVKSMCTCSDPCSTGPMCTQRKAEFPVASFLDDTGTRRIISSNCEAPASPGTLVRGVMTYPDLKEAITITDVSSVHPVAPCSMFPTGGCNSTSHQCVRQTYSGYRPVVAGYTRAEGITSQFTTTIMVPASDICCPRGWIGDSCEIPVGCSITGCDNGGKCVQAASGLAKDTTCDPATCNTGSDGGVEGWGGPFCSVRHVPMIKKTQRPSTPGRRLLTAGDNCELHYNEPIVGDKTGLYITPSRVCDCGVDWKITPVVSGLFSTPAAFAGNLFAVDYPILQIGNYKRDPLSTPGYLDTILLSPVGYHPLDTSSKPSYSRLVSSHEEAKYIAYADRHCSGYYFIPRSSTDHQLAIGRAVFFTKALTSAVKFVAAVASKVIEITIPRTVTMYTITRSKPEYSKCTDKDSPLNPLWYYNTNVLTTEKLAGTTVGNLLLPSDVTSDTTKSVISQVHWRLYGHRQPLKFQQAAGCTTAVQVREVAQFCRDPILCAPVTASPGNPTLSHTDYEVKNTLGTCIDGIMSVTRTNHSVVWTEVLDINTNVQIAGSVVKGVPVLISSEVISSGACGPTTVPPPATTTTTPAGPATIGFSSLTQDMCQDPSRVLPSRVLGGGALPSDWITGNLIHYPNSQCLCIPPFSSSGPNRTDCSDSPCRFGLIDPTVRPSTIPTPDMCKCSGLWNTDPATCRFGSCNWCATSPCITAHGATYDSKDPSGKCSCSTLFTGTHCETSLCNPTNTKMKELLATAAQGITVIQCPCETGWGGTLCDKKCNPAGGEYSVTADMCVCKPAANFKGVFCDEPICDTSRSVFNHTDNDPPSTEYPTGKRNYHCDCVPPWVGDQCQYHTCDSSNTAIDKDIRWKNNRTRAFGYPVPLKENPNLWKCQCNFPFMPSLGTVDGTDIGDDCGAHHCGYGSPDFDFDGKDNKTRADNPWDACACTKNNQGIVTKHEECKALNYKDCPKPCLYGACRLTDTEIKAHGYMDMGETDTCCKCKPGVGYYMKGVCQEFCATAQVCVKTGTSGFLAGDAFNTSKTYNEPERVYTCACKANCNTTDFSMGISCNNCWDPLPLDLDRFPPFNNKSNATAAVVTASKPPEEDTSSSGLGLLEYALIVGTTTIVGIVLAWFAPRSVTTTTTQLAGRAKMYATAKTPIHVYVVFVLMAIHALVAHASVVSLYDTDYGWSNVAGKIGDGHYGVLVTGINGNCGPRACTKYPDHKYWVCWLDPYVKVEQFEYQGHAMIQSSDFRHDVLYETVWTCQDYADLITIGGIQFPTKQLTWSSQLIDGQDYAGIWSTINICYQDSQCQKLGSAAGKCVSVPAAWRGLYGQAYEEHCEHNNECYNARVTDKTPFTREEIEIEGVNFGIKQSYRPLLQMNNYHVHGCQCGHGYHGTYCEKTCKGDRRALCMNHGKCSTSEDGVTDTSVGSLNFGQAGRACMCRQKTTGKQGCDCDEGYQGDRCQYAITTRLNASVTDWSKCCAWGSTDCTPIEIMDGPDKGAVYESAVDKCIDIIGMLVCNFESPLRVSGQHIKAPERCNEGTSYKGIKDALGLGVCWAGRGKDNPDTASFCWCNTPGVDNADPEERDNAQKNPDITGKSRLFERFGYYGSDCSIRTCTRLTYPRPQQSTTTPFMHESILNDDSKRCSGNAAIALPNDGCTDGPSVWDAKNKKYDHVNTPGECGQCEDGWGGYDGMDINGDRFAHSAFYKTRYGLCQYKTLHSIGGGRCGGYGTVNPGASESWDMLLTYPNGTMTAGVERITSCDCKFGTQRYMGMTVPPKDTGMCQRTCVNDQTKILAFFSADGLHVDTAGLDAATRSEYKQRCSSHGLCRPIMAGGPSGKDGFNSACLCDPGYMGSDCSVKVEKMHHASTLCGLNGPYEIKVLDPKYKVSEYSDVDYFDRAIASLTGQSMLDSPNLSAHRCTCSAEAQTWNYAVAYDGQGVCTSTCNSLKWPLDTGKPCNGHGQCVDIDKTNQNSGKKCHCDRGWGGERCADMLLRDNNEAMCGGEDRGTIIFSDPNRYEAGVTTEAQHCECLAGWEIRKPTKDAKGGPRVGLCYKPCPISKLEGSDGTACQEKSGHGSCVVDTYDTVNNPIKPTGNDEYCVCSTGWAGRACDLNTAPSTVSISGGETVCNGHGIPDPENGNWCLCKSGYVGFACEVDISNRACDYGQAFFDADSNGVIFTKATAVEAPLPTPPPPKLYGGFGYLYYLMANKDVADLGSNPVLHFNADFNGPQKQDLWLDTGAHGKLDVEAYIAQDYVKEEWQANIKVTPGTQPLTGRSAFEHWMFFAGHVNANGHSPQLYVIDTDTPLIKKGQFSDWMFKLAYPAVTVSQGGAYEFINKVTSSDVWLTTGYHGPLHRARYVAQDPFKDMPSVVSDKATGGDGLEGMTVWQHYWKYHPTVPTLELYVTIAQRKFTVGDKHGHFSVENYIRRYTESTEAGALDDYRFSRTIGVTREIYLDTGAHGLLDPIAYKSQAALISVPGVQEAIKAGRDPIYGKNAFDHWYNWYPQYPLLELYVL